jgi:hypothetical protein
MSKLSEELRQAARDIEAVARESSVWSNIHREVGVLADHICAKARIIELGDGNLPEPEVGVRRAIAEW